ncbi:MAG: radical SAM protein [Actinomycetota bacterium]|nr:radical SAM protein [Actinomycetota bacterium]
MKIKLIAPARKAEWGESFWDLKTLCKLTGRKSGGAPLVLPTLAALTPSDVEVILTDENVEPINFEETIDLVGITGMTCVIPRSYEIADEYRKRGVPVVMGGIHVSMLPEEAIQHCDSVVIGEAEEIWEQVIKDAQKKRVQKYYKAQRFPDLNNSPIPRWGLLKNDRYCYFTIQTSRGCPYDCEFCTVKVFNGRQYRNKTVDRVIKEIKEIQAIDNKKNLFFVDDNILANTNFSQNLMKALTSLKIKWWSQASVDKLRNNDILELMYKSGCREVFVGFESVSQSTLASMNKSQVNKIENFQETVDKIHSHGISVFASFVLGGDFDDGSIFKKTEDFILNSKFAFAMVNILTPTPGTKLYFRLENEKRIFLKEWWRYNGELVTFKPKLIQEETLQKERDKLLRNIYSYEMLYNRLDYLWNKGVFVRSANNKMIFSFGRLFFSLRILSDAKLSLSRIRFIVKSLWHRSITSIMSVLFSLNFHDYAYLNQKKGISIHEK